ncbi:MAG: hypothetical protein ACK5HY_00505, partial [Parahaliea sp.]
QCFRRFRQRAQGKRRANKDNWTASVSVDHDMSSCSRLAQGQALTLHAAKIPGILKGAAMAHIVVYKMHVFERKTEKYCAASIDSRSAEHFQQETYH